jgi:hypothetical protein
MNSQQLQMGRYPQLRSSGQSRMASGVAAIDMAAPSDSMWLDFKGLGAPIGAVLAGFGGAVCRFR